MAFDLEVEETKRKREYAVSNIIHDMEYRHSYSLRPVVEVCSEFRVVRTAHLLIDRQPAALERLGFSVMFSEDTDVSGTDHRIQTMIGRASSDGRIFSEKKNALGSFMDWLQRLSHSTRARRRLMKRCSVEAARNSLPAATSRGHPLYVCLPPFPFVALLFYHSVPPGTT